MLLAELPADWQLFFEFLAPTGLRVGEAIGRTWAHVGLGEHPRIRVREQVYRGKRRRLKSGSARRDIPLSGGMGDRLLAHRRDAFTGEDSPVFPSAAGTPLSPSNVHGRVLEPAAIGVGSLSRSRARAAGGGRARL